MSADMIGLIGVILVILLMLLKVPIGFAMLFVGFLGFAMLSGFEDALGNLMLVPYSFMSDYTFSVIPFFVLMGLISASSGISKDLYTAAYSWIGRARGGLAMATVLACGGFAAICGSSMAATATIGKICVPEMERYNYDPKFAAGCVAAGGTLASLIPPSLTFIMYSMLTEESVGQLFMAGILPGITEILFYLAAIYIVCKINPVLGPRGPKVSFTDKLLSIRKTGAMLLLFIVVMGGIYIGIFTATEAGAIGASVTIVISVIMRRLSLRGFFDSLVETARVTSMILILIIGAMVFNRFLAISGLPFTLAEFMANLSLPTYAILACILFVYLILGCILDVVPCVILTLPILFPVIKSLGIDPIWYGVLMVRVIEIGLITPPVGMSVFVLAAAVNLPVGQIYRGIAPFFIADVLDVALLVAVPQISLFLPRTMMT